MNKVVGYITMFVVLMSSCNKDEPYDEEAGMETGRATVLKSVELIDTFNNYLTAKAEFVHLNGLESETSFSLETPENHFIYGTQSTITSDYSYSPTNALGYKNMIMVYADNLIWLEKFSPGYYLKRYFEIVENTTSCEAGVSFIGSKTDYEVNYYTESSSSLFNSTASFNLDAYYDITRTENTVAGGYQDGAEIELKAFLEGLEVALDSIGAYSTPGENLAITLFMAGNYGFEAGTEDLFLSVFQKLEDYNIQMHVITNYHGIYDMQLAMYSGGMHHVTIGCFVPGETYELCEPGQRVTSTGVLLQNIHDLLLNNYTSHVVEFEMSMTDITLYNNSQYIHGGILYNNILYPVTVNKQQ